MNNLTAVLASALCFAVVSSAVAQSREFAPTETSASLPLAGRPIQVFGGLGDVAIVKATDDKVTVTVTRGTEGTVVPRILVAETTKGIVICADWITKAGTPSPCGTSKRRLATNALKDYARADLRIAVPEGTSVNALVSHGNITAEPVSGSLRLDTYVGDIHGVADGPVFTAENLHGAIEVRVGDRMQSQKLKVDSLDGKIHLIIPPDRLVHYTLYAAGSVLRSDYVVGGQEDYAQKGSATHVYRLSENAISGNIGPSKLRGPWADLEIYMTNKEDGDIEITMPK